MYGRNDIRTDSAQPAASSKGEISHQGEILDGSISDLRDAVESLEQRLGAILQSGEPVGKDSPTPTNSATQMGMFIENEAARVQALTRWVHSILNRIAL